MDNDHKTVFRYKVMKEFNSNTYGLKFELQKCAEKILKDLKLILENHKSFMLKIENIVTKYSTKLLENETLQRLMTCFS